MFEKINLRQRAAVEVTRKQPKSSLGMEDQLNLRGRFEVEHWRNGIMIGKMSFRNGIVNEGKNKLLNVMFDAATAVTTWYMLLIPTTGYTALANDDIYDDIDQAGNGWDEFKTYTDPGNADSTVTRPVWNPAPASGQSISNSSQVVFDITGSATIKGIGIVGAPAGATAVPATKGDHAADGVLWATALFDQGDTAVVNGDQLKITYTVSA